MNTTRSKGHSPMHYSDSFSRYLFAIMALLLLSHSPSAQNKKQSVAPEAPTLPERAQWLYEAHGCLPHDAAYADGRLYLGTCARTFHCIDAKTGTGLWVFNIPDSTLSAVHGDPAISDSLIFFGTDYSWENPKIGALYALNRFDGTLKWKAELGAGVGTDIAQSKSLIYVITLNDRLVALSKQTGKIQWEKQTDWLFSPVTRTPHLSSPLVIDSVLYFPGRDSTLYALRARDGKEIWKRKFPIELLLRIARVDNNILVGGLDSLLSLVSCADGSIVATRKLDARPVKLPLVTENMIYLYAGDKSNEPRTIRAYTKDLSAEKWRATTTDLRESPYFCSNRLSYINGSILAGSYDGKILAFDEEDGEFVWDLSLTGPITLVQAIDSMVLGGNLKGHVTLQSPKKGIKAK